MGRTRPSAGLLVHRRREGRIEVLLVHPGGPFWKNQDLGAWSIPKGEIDDGEDPLAAAKRELNEETGFAAKGPFRALDPVRLKSGKIVHAWACEAEGDQASFCSSTFEMEWPPRSGQVQRFPEVDRAEFFDVSTAEEKINQGQRPLLEQLERLLV